MLASSRAREVSNWLKKLPYNALEFATPWSSGLRPRFAPLLESCRCARGPEEPAPPAQRCAAGGGGGAPRARACRGGHLVGGGAWPRAWGGATGGGLGPGGL